MFEEDFKEEEFGQEKVKELELKMGEEMFEGVEERLRRRQKRKRKRSLIRGTLRGRRGLRNKRCLRRRDQRGN